METQEEALLQEINEQARHWHKQVNLMGGDALNGEFYSIQFDVNRTQELLDELWEKLRHVRAKPDSERFKDWHGITREESVFLSPVHIQPLN